MEYNYHAESSSAKYKKKDNKHILASFLIQYYARKINNSYINATERKKTLCSVCWIITILIEIPFVISALPIKFNFNWLLNENYTYIKRWYIIYAIYINSSFLCALTLYRVLRLSKKVPQHKQNCFQYLHSIPTNYI